MSTNYSDDKYVSYSGNFSVKYSDTPNSKMFNLHIHDAYEITLILSDDVEVLVNDVSYPVPYGSLLLFNTMDAHMIRYKGNKSYRRFVLWFKQEFLAELDSLSYKLLRCFFLRNFDKANMLSLTPEQLKQTREIYNKLKHLKKNDFMTNERLKLAVGEFLILVNEFYFKQNVNNLPDQHNDYTSVYKAILHIQENFSEGVTRKTLSTLTGVNERTLCEYFKNVTGLTTNQYILTFRISASKNLLLKGIPSAEVAEKMGFDDYSNFSRTFKKHVGLSPKQYAMRFLKKKSNNTKS